MPLKAHIYFFHGKFFFLNFSCLNEIGNLILELPQGTEKSGDSQELDECYQVVLQEACGRCAGVGAHRSLFVSFQIF